ncbi:probable aspartic protease At2g35615 [Punica granatum]|uniref:Probable aspartic protease At2g35615 n=1 Tax=Punica granatum TaxID=22663 RepID=A0A6P8EBD4_PUNGR|nr:probable aspartic protease At2g35615 [Punica granatum]
MASSSSIVCHYYCPSAIAIMLFMYSVYASSSTPTSKGDFTWQDIILKGNIAIDKVSLSSITGKPIAFPEIVIGFSHEDGSPFNRSVSANRPNAISIISQMGQVAAQKFSYCMVPYFTRSKRSSKLESAITSRVKFERVPDPHHFFSPCYNTTTYVGPPNLTMHSKGADVQLGPSNTFLRITSDVTCFNIVPSNLYPVYDIFVLILYYIPFL